MLIELKLMLLKIQILKQNRSAAQILNINMRFLTLKV